MLVSRTVRDLVAGAKFDFTKRGEHELKGFSDKWILYSANFVLGLSVSLQEDGFGSINGSHHD